MLKAFQEGQDTRFKEQEEMFLKEREKTCGYLLQQYNLEKSEALKSLEKTCNDLMAAQEKAFQRQLDEKIQ